MSQVPKDTPNTDTPQTTGYKSARNAANAAKLNTPQNIAAAAAAAVPSPKVKKEKKEQLSVQPQSQPPALVMQPKWAIENVVDGTLLLEQARKVAEKRSNDINMQDKEVMELVSNGIQAHLFMVLDTSMTNNRKRRNKSCVTSFENILRIIQEGNGVSIPLVEMRLNLGIAWSPDVYDIARQEELQAKKALVEHRRALDMRVAAEMKALEEERERLRLSKGIRKSDLAIGGAEGPQELPKVVQEETLMSQVRREQAAERVGQLGLRERALLRDKEEALRRYEVNSQAAKRMKVADPTSSISSAGFAIPTSSGNAGSSGAQQMSSSTRHEDIRLQPLPLHGYKNHIDIRGEELSIFDIQRSINDRFGGGPGKVRADYPDAFLNYTTVYPVNFAPGGYSHL